MLFGERLIAEGLLASRDLERALAAQREMGGYIGDVLTRLGLIAEPDLFRMLAEHLQVDWIQKMIFQRRHWRLRRCRRLFCSTITLRR
jgi:hypothetical protein